jgi:hypothetical protein
MEVVIDISHVIFICLLAGFVNPSLPFVRITQETARAFDRYVQAAESRMAQDSRSEHFLRMDAMPDIKAKVRGGELPILPGSNRGADDQVPGGLLQDWVGMVFIPGATVEQVKDALQDYDSYSIFYRPKVIASKALFHHDDQYDIMLRLYEKHILTVVLNTEYHVQYGMVDPRRMIVTSRSTRIAEVTDPKRSYTQEQPVGNDSGFLWRLNSYWRFEAGDGGVYGECEAISLSRNVPLGLGFMLRGFLEQFPRDSMLNTLKGTKASVQARQVEAGRDR